MSAKGYISLHRQIWNDEMWLEEPFTKAQAWIDLLLMANHEDNGIYKRGCVYTSVSILAKRWKWSEKKVRNYLKYLEGTQKVIRKGTRKGTTLTLVNYGKWQKQGHTEGHTKGHTKGRLTINPIKDNNPPLKEEAENYNPNPEGEDPAKLMERWKKDNGY